MPACPDELVNHRIVEGPASTVPSAWRFERDGVQQAPELEAHISVNENEGAVAAVIAGMGITSTTWWACRREVEQGALVLLLTDWTLVGTPVHAFFPMGRSTRQAARAVIEHLASEFDRESGRKLD